MIKYFHHSTSFSEKCFVFLTYSIGQDIDLKTTTKFKISLQKMFRIVFLIKPEKKPLWHGTLIKVKNLM